MKYEKFGVVDHEHFTIELRPTTKCNYNCYYCTDLHINSNPVYDINQDAIVELVKSAKYNTKKPIHIYICGGEPTLYSKLESLVICLSQELTTPDYITIQTNLSKPLKWLKKFTHALKNNNLKIKLNCSYHNTQETNILGYIGKCLFLKSVSMLGVVSLAFNQRKDVVTDYEKMVEMIGEAYCEIVPLINASVDQDPKKGNNSDHDIDHINNLFKESELEPTGHFFRRTLPYTLGNVEDTVSRNEMWLTRRNNFMGYKCDVSKNKLYVDWDGNCYSCFNYQFAEKPPLFHISMTDKFDNYFSNISCIDCPFKTCFFDLEYLKTYQDKEIDMLPIDRKFNTNEHRSA